MTGLPIADTMPGNVTADYTNFWANLTDYYNMGSVMTASADSDASTASGCGLANYQTYVIVAPFTTTYSGSTVKLVLMRDPSGVSPYNGDWRSADSTHWSSSTKADVPFSVDPTSSTYIN